MLIEGEYFKNIFNTVREAILILDENMKVLSANRSFFTIFKVDSANTIGSLLYDLGNGQWDIPYLRVLLEEVLPKNDTVDNYEIEHNFENIGQKTMLLNACKIREKKTDLPIILLAIEDITERKRLEDLLTESEMQYRRLFETASDGIVLLEKSDGHIVHTNPAARKMLGYSEEESVGKKLQDMGVSLDMSDFPAVMQDLNNRGILNYEDVPVKTKSGQYIDTDIYLVDRAKLAQCNIRDVTERKRAAETLKEEKTFIENALNSLQDIFFVFDLKGRFLRWNKTMTVVTGYIDGEINLMTVTDLFRKDEVERVSESIREVVREGSVRIEAIGITKDGRQIPYELTAALLRDAHGEPIGISGVGRDISERKQAEDALKNSEKEFRLLAESMPQIVWVTRPDGWNTYFNHQWINYTGQTLEESYGHGWNKPFHPDDRKRAWDAWQNAIKYGATYSLECRLRRADGVYKWWLVRGVPVMDEQGAVLKWFGTCTDIEDIKKAEAEREQYFNFFQAATDIMVIADPNGAFKKTNPACTEILGYSESDLLAKPFIDFVHPDDKQATLDEMARQKKTGASMNFENRYLCKDGSLRFLSWRATYKKDEGITYAVASDITERKEAEDALKNSEKEFHLLAESLPQIVWVSRPDGWNTYINRQWIDYTGLTLEESLGHGWNKPFHPDDRKRAWDAWQKATKCGAAYSLECRLRRADGAYKWWLVRGVPVRDDHGDVLKWFGTGTDIDDMKRVAEELKTSEERFRTAVESLTDVLFEWDIKERITWYGVIDSLMGYPPEGFPRTMEGWKATIHPEDKDRLMAALEAQLKDAAPYAVEYRVRRRDGEWRWWSARGTAIRDDQGNPYKMVGSITDITERKLVEEEKLKLEAQLRHAQKMEAIGTLAGGIAHDFNNILNVIMGYGNMVMDTLEADSPSKENMHEVLIAADRAANLTKRLLVFSRKQVVEMHLININALIHGLQKMLVRTIREDIELNLDLVDRPLIVLADLGQIEQVIMNLASNARDAMPEGGRLTIGTGIQEIDDNYTASYGYGKPGTYALITIADTGHGMDVETQELIFEPFFTTKGIGEGTGLGLAISYGIIKQHNGYIRAYSELGKGTVFKIYLPLVKETADQDKKAEAVVPVNGGNETILVAEDDASLRKLNRIVLESYGYSIISAENGEDAIAKFMENRDKIQLAILDMIMPKKNGKEVSEAIRKVSPQAKILFTSGYTMNLIKNRELTEAGFDFLLKPIFSKDLLRKVREVLDR